MEKRAMKYAVFDLDGTLVDSLPGIAEGLNRALASLGMPPYSQREVRGMVGRGARLLCAEALRASPLPYDEVRVDALLAAFGREYPQTWEEGTVPYPGIAAMLERLAESGHRLAVLSNKPHAVTVPLVRQVFPNVAFDVVLGFSERFPRKPDPASLLWIVSQWGVQPHEAVLVGDSIHDAATARAAGTQLGLVAWGYPGASDLAAQGAPVFRSAEALEAFLQAVTP